MEVALRTPVPVGLVRWRDPPSCYSVVVKVTLDANDGRGPATLSATQLPLYEGERDNNGVVLEPTDFVEAKSICDVVLAGSTMNGARPVRVRVGTIDASIGPAVPVMKPMHGGSCAPADQRIPIPSLPLSVGLEYPGHRAVALIPAPAPSAAILARGQSRATPIMLRADTIFVHPWESKITVVYRGTFHHAGDVDRDLTMLVDISGRISQSPQRDIGKWPHQEVMIPELDPRDLDTPTPEPAGEAPPLARQITLEMQAAPDDDLCPSPTLDMIAPDPASLPSQKTMDMPAVDPSALPPQHTMQLHAGSVASGAFIGDSTQDLPHLAVPGLVPGAPAYAPRHELDVMPPERPPILFGPAPWEVQAAQQAQQGMPQQIQQPVHSPVSPPMQQLHGAPPPVAYAAPSPMAAPPSTRTGPIDFADVARHAPGLDPALPFRAPPQRASDADDWGETTDGTSGSNPDKGTAGRR